MDNDIIAILMNNFAIVSAVLLFFVGWAFGGLNERKHLARLDKDEQAYRDIIVSSERFYRVNSQQGSQLVVGNVVVAQDRFKMVIAQFLSIFGKNLMTYETLLERGRREAIVRMKARAHLAGYDAVMGVRLEISNVGANDPSGDAIEVIAYGTAFKR